MTTKTQAKLNDMAKPTLGYKSFQNRKTAELIFAFVEPIGGGAKDVAIQLEHMLLDQYKYQIGPTRTHVIGPI